MHYTSVISYAFALQVSTSMSPRLGGVRFSRRPTLRGGIAFDIGTRYDRFMAKSADILQGTLDLLILRTLDLQPLHGVGVADRIEQLTKGVFVVGPGSLFPALHRLADQGWIEGQWGELDSGRRAKCYALTPAGRKQLAEKMRNWHRVNTAVTQVLAEEG
jgi:PadR family transcriptional regulator, regulatory protein PadR